MEQLFELTKALHASRQLQQQQLQEIFEKLQKIFQDELIHLREQQTKNT